MKQKELGRIRFARLRENASCVEMDSDYWIWGVLTEWDEVLCNGREESVE